MKLNITIDRMENDNAVLKTNDNKTIIWPRHHLPEGSREGSVLIFDINSSHEEEKEQKQRVKDILNEILDIE
jgi:hypothetical protein